MPKQVRINQLTTDQTFEPGTPIKQWVTLKSGERVWIDRQNGDGQKAWFYSGKRQIDPDEVDLNTWEPWGVGVTNEGVVRQE